MADNLLVSTNLNTKPKIVNLLNLTVVRRDGSITPFKSDKISNAIKKAFLAQTKIRNNKNKEKEQQGSIYRTVEDLTKKVVAALTRRIADGNMIHIAAAKAHRCPGVQVYRDDKQLAAQLTEIVSTTGNREYAFQEVVHLIVVEDS